MSAYRNDVDALEARRAALASEVEAKRRELDEAARLLEESKARAKLPVLDNIRVASPCHEPWSQMTGDARVRSCDACNLRVYNLSELTRDEAQALLVEHEGRLCVRYFQRADGTILLKDCTIGVQRRRKRRLVAAGAAALLASGAAGVITYQRSGGAATHAVAEDAATHTAAEDACDPREHDRDRARTRCGSELRRSYATTGVLARSLEVTAEELAAANRDLTAARAEVEAAVARDHADRDAALARLRAAEAAAATANASTAALQQAHAAAEAELEAAQARARALEKLLAHPHVDELVR